MHPSNVAFSIHAHGYWYTYFTLREEYCCDRIRTVWLMWVAYWYNRHHA